MIGHTIGKDHRYRVVAALGDGGMASVYAAVEERTGQRVALKVLHAHFAENAPVFLRFQREAQTCAALRHPNIVQVTDFQANPGEPPFLVMELVTGASLAELVARAGPVPGADAAAIATQILSALEAAHAAGVIHRDLKPANIVVALGMRGPIAKLVDFGVAKLLHEAAEERLTATGNIVGTPYFMAPEQARRRPVDARTDIYGLGATMYFAVSGQRPYAEVPRAGLVDAICQSPPERLLEIRPDADPGLVAIIERAMSKRPEDRFGSAAEMGAAIARWTPRDPALGVTPPAPARQPSFGDDVVEPDLPKPGDVVAGKYRVERVVGKGGMGIVYAAKHEVLDQPVALKILIALADSESTQRFVNEAKMVSRMKSDHVCRIFDAGTLPSGRPFIAMELLSGVDLATVISKRRELPIAEAVDFLLQGLEAVAQAHALKVVHRDLKPSNFFLTDHGGEQFVKVLDFGISKSAEAAGSLTIAGTVIGSPAYMSPEQVRDASAVDTRSDIWSLGVVLYELLTGASPFPASTLGEIFHGIFTKAPASLRARRPDVPRGLEDVVFRCLEKDPSSRFPDVHALAVALAPFGRKDARAAERIERIRAALGKPAHADRSRAATPLVVGAVAALAVGIAGGSIAARMHRQARSAADTAPAPAPAPEVPAADLAPAVTVPDPTPIATVPPAVAPVSTVTPSAAPSAKPRPRTPPLLDRRH